MSDLSMKPVSTPDTQTRSSNLVRTLVLFGGSVALLGLLAVFAWSLTETASSDLFDAPAPAFTLTTFEGETLSLADLEGQVVVLNFWASWCIECYDEAPVLEELARAYRDRGVVFVGVAYLDTQKEALEYMARYDITYPSGLDVGTVISDDYFITGVPETFIIDRQGQINHVQIGPIARPQLIELIESALAEGSS